MISQRFFCVGLAVAGLLHLMLIIAAPVVGQTVSAPDQPEEVLRTEIILEARSPIDGKPITAAEYAELEAQIDERNREIGTVPSKIRRLITLLRIRKVLRAIFPFIP